MMVSDREKLKIKRGLMQRIGEHIGYLLGNDIEFEIIYKDDQSFELKTDPQTLPSSATSNPDGGASTE